MKGGRGLWDDWLCLVVLWSHFFGLKNTQIVFFHAFVSSLNGINEYELRQMGLYIMYFSISITLSKF